MEESGRSGILPACLPVQPMTSHHGVWVPNRPRTPKITRPPTPVGSPAPRRGEVRLVKQTVSPLRDFNRI